MDTGIKIGDVCTFKDDAFNNDVVYLGEYDNGAVLSYIHGLGGGIMLIPNIEQIEFKCVFGDSQIDRNDLEYKLKAIIGTKDKETDDLIEEYFDGNIRYAYGNEQLKTWFISKSDDDNMLPNGSKLLFKMWCVKTNDSISTSDVYPLVGDIVCDINGDNLKIEKIEWT